MQRCVGTPILDNLELPNSPQGMAAAMQGDPILLQPEWGGVLQAALSSPDRVNRPFASSLFI